MYFVLAVSPIDHILTELIFIFYTSCISYISYVLVLSVYAKVLNNSNSGFPVTLIT